MIVFAPRKARELPESTVQALMMQASFLYDLIKINRLRVLYLSVPQIEDEGHVLGGHEFSFIRAGICHLVAQHTHLGTRQNAGDESAHAASASRRFGWIGLGCGSGVRIILNVPHL